MREFEPRPGDEIVSAYLDGEATPEERARVENSPELLDRLETFRRTARAVGTPHFFADAPDADPLVSRAIAAGSSAEVVDLDRVRARRRTGWIAAVAAAAVLVAVPILGSAGGDDRASETAAELPADADTTAEALVEAAGRAEDVTALDDGDPGASTPDAPMAGDDAGPEPTTGDAAVPFTPGPVDEQQLEFLDSDLVDQLGAHPDRAAASATITDWVDEVLATPSETIPDDQVACASWIRYDEELGPLVAVGRFSVDADVRLALLFELRPDGAVNGSHRLVEVRLDGCLRLSASTFR